MRIIPNHDDIGISRWDDDDFEPSRHERMHEDEKLCKWNLGRVVSTVPLQIRSSLICKGSGLFAAAAIPAGREIYHVVPIMDAISADNSSFCSYCLKDTQEVLGGPSKANEEAKACSSCRAARFCSKVRLSTHLDSRKQELTSSVTRNARDRHGLSTIKTNARYSRRRQI